jgi:hypothetical protein
VGGGERPQIGRELRESRPAEPLRGEQAPASNMTDSLASAGDSMP